MRPAHVRRAPSSARAAASSRPAAAVRRAAYDGLTPAQRFEFDVRGYYVLKGYYTAEEVATFNGLTSCNKSR